MRNLRGLLLALFLVCIPVKGAFHGPPLSCSNCHTMHNTVNGQSITGGKPEGYLLKTSGGCRGCHDGSMLSAGAPDIFSALNKPGTSKEAPSGSFFEMSKPESQV